MEEHLLCCVFLLFVTVSAGDSVFTVKNKTAGDDVELLCPVPEGTVLVLEWTNSDGYLLFYRDGKIIERYQDEQFRNRVQPPDLKMKSGNLGVILKDITTDDSGTYKCEALVQTSGGERKVFTHSTQLFVEETPRVAQARMALNDREMMRALDVEGESSQEKQASALSNDTGSTALVLGLSVFGIAAVLGFVFIAFLNREPIKRHFLKEKRPVPGFYTPPAEEPLNCSV